MSTGVGGVWNCPVHVLVRYGTFVVRRSGIGGTLLYGIGVASGAVPVPVPYRYGTGTVRYTFGMDCVDRYITVPVRSQCSFALTGLAARANHLFYRFRTVFRLPYAIRPWYESRVRPVSPSDLVLWSVRAHGMRAR